MNYVKYVFLARKVTCRRKRGDFMEKNLRKSGIYGFILGIALSILFVDYKEVYVSRSGDNVVTTYEPLLDYIVSILRIGTIGMFIGLFVGWNMVVRKREKQQAKTYYMPVFFAVFIVAIISQFLFNW